MFLKSNNAPPPIKSAVRKVIPSVMSSEVNILGNLVSDGPVDFDGTIDGNIRCASLVLRPNSRVNGEVYADSVQVYGRVKGLIRARLVHLYATCFVEGIIMHETISIEDGATIEGKFKRTNKMPSFNAPHAPDRDSFAEEEMEQATPKLLENLRLIAG